MAIYIKNQDRDRVYPLDIMSLFPANQNRLTRNGSANHAVQGQDCHTGRLRHAGACGNGNQPDMPVSGKDVYGIGLLEWRVGGMVNTYLAVIVRQLRELIAEIKRLNENFEKQKN